MFFPPSVLFLFELMTFDVLSVDIFYRRHFYFAVLSVKPRMEKALSAGRSLFKSRTVRENLFSRRTDAESLFQWSVHICLNNGGQIWKVCLVVGQHCKPGEAYTHLITVSCILQIYRKM
jgi:hypothetical protein